MFMKEGKEKKKEEDIEEMFIKEKKKEATEEDKLWYRGQSGPLGRSAGRVSQLSKGRMEGGEEMGEEVRKSSILNWQGRKY